jgi:hypothetical protein
MAASPDFSKAVLQGASLRGLSAPEIAKIADLPPERIDEVIAGRMTLTRAQLAAVERHTGLKAGQLAALAIEPHGGPLTEISNVLAAAMSNPTLPLPEAPAIARSPH